jgi:hypothetical protein
MDSIGRIFATGLAGALASMAAAMVCSRIENRHAARAINAISHIYDGGPPPAHEGPARRNTAIGLALHTGASVWWAAFHEAFCGSPVKRTPGKVLAAGAATSALAYVVDYHVVPRRFRPGFEAYLSPASMAAVYAALALGFATMSQKIARKAAKAGQPSANQMR